jgi:hypothetical protein
MSTRCLAPQQLAKAAFTRQPVARRALRVATMAQLSQDELKKQVGPQCARDRQVVGTPRPHPHVPPARRRRRLCAAALPPHNHPLSTVPTPS